MAQTATLHTNHGDIAIDLFGDHSPVTVRNFIGLATGLKKWPTELAAHTVQASGAQVDVIERMLPVIQLHR